jgi:hypothetical protein
MEIAPEHGETPERGEEAGTPSSIRAAANPLAASEGGSVTQDEPALDSYANQLTRGWSKLWTSTATPSDKSQEAEL